MGIQLAMNVQIPVDLGGLGGKAVFVGQCQPFAVCILCLTTISSCIWCLEYGAYMILRYRRQLYGGMGSTNC
ncbi:hypothetical protein C1H46_044384 [Malus baccata]|uniref:Uncharacterized protein n=1 Tax=Malus baccata TaxID=106549 RepID=A0A540K779_MALBA|nr:hypothetical protein C1H46_044384 [Malus baccata]